MKRCATFPLIAALVLTLLCAPALTAAEPAKWVTYKGGEGPGAGKYVVLIAGDEEYRSEEALPQLGKILAVHHGFTCTVLFSQNPETGEIDPTNQNNIPGLHLLEKADMVVLGLRFRNPPENQMKYFVDYVNSGKPLLGTRTSTHAFNFKKGSSKYDQYSFNSREWKGGFGQQVLGETWINHHGGHGRESTRGVINKQYASHPILKGVKDIWGPTDVYGVRNLKDGQVLVHGQVLQNMKPDSEPKKDKAMMPLIWTRSYTGEAGKPSRIVCTTMGASVDLANDGFRRAMVNSVYWCLKMEDQIPAESNVELVGQFKPTFFGFNKFTRGVMPSAHKLKQ